MSPRNRSIEMSTLRSAAPAPAMGQFPGLPGAPVRRDLVAHPITVRAETVNEEMRSVEVVLASENEVRAFSLREFRPVQEVLLMSGFEPPSGGQVPLIESHFRWSTDAIHGSIRQLRVSDGQLIGTAYFAGDEDSLRKWDKVREGHLTDISVGTLAHEYEIVRPGETKRIKGRSFTASERPIYITTRWTPKEGSLVVIGADEAAKIREDLSGHDAHSTRKHAMNEQLRTFLEGIGLRVDATVDDAWSFYRGLTGAQRSAAEALRGDDEPSTPETAASQRSAQAGAGDQATERTTAAPTSAPGSALGDPPAGQGQRTETDTEAIRAEAIAAERQRVAGIINLAGDDMPQELVRRALTENWSTERSATEFLTHHRAQFHAPTGPNGAASGPDVRVGTDRARDQNIRLLAGGLMQRCGTRFEDPELTDSERTDQAETMRQARRYRDVSLLRICEECIRMDGGRVPLSRSETIRAAVATGALSSVFTTSINARLMAAYLEATDTSDWVSVVDVTNFMTQERELIAPEGGLEKLGRGGTAKMSAPSGVEETYKIARYAKQLVVDEQDIIDDRLDVFQRKPMAMGLAAARLRPDLVYAIILANAALGADSVALFHADHANLDGNALNAANLAAGVAAMMKQTHGGVQLNLMPRYVLTPPDLTLTAAELVKSSQIVIAGTAGAVTTRGSHNVLADLDLQVRGDGRLGAAGVTDPNSGTAYTGSATNWFLAAAHPDTVEVAYLAGTGRRPQLRSFTLDRGQWGVGWDIKHDIGAKALDYRGLYQGNT